MHSFLISGSFIFIFLLILQFYIKISKTCSYLNNKISLGKDFTPMEKLFLISLIFSDSILSKNKSKN